MNIQTLKTTKEFKNLMFLVLMNIDFFFLLDFLALYAIFSLKNN